MNRNGIPAKVAPLFSGHDAAHYKLPPDIVALKDAATRVQTAIQARQDERMALSPGGAADGLGKQYLDAALDGGDLAAVGVDEILKGQARAEALALMLDGLERAAGDIAAQLESVVFDPRIVPDSLAPAFADTLKLVRSLAPALGGRDVSQPAAFIGAQGDAVKAYQRLQAAVARHSAIRVAQRITSDHAQDESLFSTFLDPAAAWGPQWTGRHLNSWKPWPTDPAAYLLWLATSPEAQAGKPGIYTVDQREAAYREYVATKSGQPRPGVIGVAA